MGLAGYISVDPRLRPHSHQLVCSVNMILKLVLFTLAAVVGADKLPSTSYGAPSRGSGGFPGAGGGRFGASGVRGGFGSTGVRGGFGSHGVGGSFGSPGVGGGFGTSGAGFGGGPVGGFGASPGGFARPGSGAFGVPAGSGFGGAASGSSFGGSYRPSGPVVPILRDDRQGPDAYGNYNFNFETGDGISRQEQGAPQGPTGAVASQGGWSFTFPDGTPANFKFVADEGGYRVESPLLPTPPPLPAHAIAQIEKARQEDAAAAAGGGRGSYGAASGSSSQFSGVSGGGFGGAPSGGFGGAPSRGFGGAPSGGFGGAPSGGFGGASIRSFGGAGAGGFGAAPLAPRRTYGAP